MKKRITLLLLLLSAGCIAAIAQKVQHHSFVTYYNASLKEPDSVSWQLSPAMVGCGKVTRKDKFARDPQISGSALPKDYKNSGYDKGHMFPFADAQCDATDQAECFYMSNMLPQLHALNAGDWKTLEEQERTWAASQTVIVIAGGHGTLGRLPSGVNIPESCWKAIYVDHHWRGFVMPNLASSKGHSFDAWEVKDIKRFDAVTGLNL